MGAICAVTPVNEGVHAICSIHFEKKLLRTCSKVGRYAAKAVHKLKMMLSLRSMWFYRILYSSTNKVKGNQDR